MACCPPLPSINVGGSGDEDYAVQSSEIRRGESVECYAARAGNTTGLHDDATDYPKDKILNTDIPIAGDASVDVQFELTPNPTEPAKSWKLYEGDSTTPITNLYGVTFSETAGTLRGAFSAQVHGKQLKIKVSAFKENGEEIDQRGFTFSPAIATGSNEIRFIHPLPGSRVTSKFGVRVHPVTGVQKPHHGADFAYAGGKIGDVLAAADGTVEFTGTQNGGAGNYIKIRHNSPAGKYLCTTVYMHLNQIYVKKDQKVCAGQKIGLEGNTGVGTGPHLHFECRLPNGNRVDPVPLIKGELQVAQQTKEDNSPVDGSLKPQNSNAVLTSENVDAKVTGCEPFGPTYPKDPKETNDPPPASGSSDPFEQAWFFTMTHEVGPFWTPAFPSDPDVAAGAIETRAQRTKCGYVNTPGYPGGETKFGIAAGPNPGVNVTTMGYEAARKMGFNNYWKRGKVTPEALSAERPKAAIMLFDMNYLHGVGNANFIRSKANIDGLGDEDTCRALHAAQQEFMQNIITANPQRVKYKNGWLKRSKELLEYALST